MSSAPTAQGWIINRGCDVLFFIGTPLLSLAALLVFRALGADVVDEL